MTSYQLFKSGLLLATAGGILSISAVAATPAIGMASANSDKVVLDNATIAGSATVFDGSTIRSAGYARIHLNNGTRVDFSAGSNAQIFAHRTALQSGMSEIQSSSGYEIDANSLKIQPAEANSIARVTLNGNNGVVVMALNAPVNVLGSDGLLVARVLPSKSMAFLPQAGSAAPRFDVTGCVLQKGTSAIVVDDSSKQVYELRQPEGKAPFNNKLIGNHARVVGVVDSAATVTPQSGAQQVVVYGSIKETKKGGCADLASSLGAATVASAGLAVAAAGGAAAGAATAAAVGAGVAVGAATGVSTAVVVAAGVGAAAAAGVAGASAAGSFSSTSP